MVRAAALPSSLFTLARVAVAASALLAAGAHAQVVFSASGATGGAIAPTVDDFRTALGALNPNLPGSVGSGRREINWDGVPDGFSAPNSLPGNFFNVNSPRGVLLTTPGTDLQVSADSANPSGTAPQFANIDPAYPGFFEPFSQQRLFTAIGSNIVDVNFAVPGAADAALTRGFGVVFSDVDFADTTSLTFFDRNGASLGTFFAPVSGGDNEGFSFLGVVFAGADVSRVRITNGDKILAAGTVTQDLVVMDDFIYGEPIAIPEPETYALMLVGLGALGGWLRRRGRAAVGRSADGR